jgi:hypothetical protein
MTVNAIKNIVRVVLIYKTINIMVRVRFLSVSLRLTQIDEFQEQSFKKLNPSQVYY